MRIIAGKFKGSTLFIPKDKSIRPLKDMVRESVFNLLTHSKRITFKFEESKVLDLFAGTGSFGLECLSRQANETLFIEKEIKAITILKKNISKLKLEKKTKIIVDDISIWIKRRDVPELKFDLIFCDPPFRTINIENLIELISNKKLLKNKGVLVLHRYKKSNDKFPLQFKIIEERIYGLSKIIFGKFLF